MLSLEEMREKLSDRALHIVAKNAGLSRKTLYNFMAGQNPSYKTMEKLYKYLKETSV